MLPCRPGLHHPVCLVQGFPSYKPDELPAISRYAQPHGRPAERRHARWYDAANFWLAGACSGSTAGSVRSPSRVGRKSDASVVIEGAFGQSGVDRLSETALSRTVKKGQQVSSALGQVLGHRGELPTVWWNEGGTPGRRPPTGSGLRPPIPASPPRVAGLALAIELFSAEYALRRAPPRSRPFCRVKQAVEWLEASLCRAGGTDALAWRSAGSVRPLAHRCLRGQGRACTDGQAAGRRSGAAPRAARTRKASFIEEGSWAHDVKSLRRPWRELLATPTVENYRADWVSYTATSTGKEIKDRQADDTAHRHRRWIHSRHTASCGPSSVQSAHLNFNLRHLPAPVRSCRVAVPFLANS